MPSRSKQRKLKGRSSVKPPVHVSSTIVRAILVVVLAATPLALVTGTFLSHDVIPKTILILTGAALLLFLLPQWWKGLGVLWDKPRGRLFLLLVGAQFASLLVSTVFSERLPLSLAGTVWRRFGLIEQSAVLVIAIAVVCSAALWPVFVTTLLRAAVVCGGVAACYGILQYFNFDPFLDRSLYSIDYFGGVTRPPATMGHALYFSAYLVPIVFIAASLAGCDNSPLWRRIHTAVAVGACAAIVVSGTRSAVLALLGGGILFLWRQSRDRIAGVSWKYAAVPAIAIGASAIFIVSPPGANLRHRLLQFRTETGGPRLQMWRESPALIGEHPLLGAGPETFAAEFRRIQSAALSRAYPDFFNETPHNAFLDAACAQGIPGLLILAGIFALAFSARAGGVGERDSLRTGLAAALLGILISSMFASLVLVTSLFLWSIAGLAVGMCPGATDEVPALRIVIARIPAALAGVVILIAATALSVQDAAWAQLGVDAGRGDFAAASQAYSIATSFLVGLPGYELWGSRTMASLGRSLGNAPDGAAAWKLAADAAALAEVRNEEPFSAAYQSSVLAVAASDVTRAEIKARKVIRLAPNWYKGHLLLSQILQITGKNQEAARESALSESLGWKKQ